MNASAIGQDVRGARFFRCALQVNPYAYLARHSKETSYASEADYNQALVEALVQEGIEVICVTDHYRVKTAASLSDAARARGIHVFVGFEAVSKDGVHFLCIFNHDVDVERIDRIIGECGIRDDATPSPSGSLDSQELIERAPTWGAVLVAAHAASTGGLLTVLSGQARVRVWQNEQLLACSLPGPPEEAPAALRPILLNTDAAHKRAWPIAVVNAQDVSDPASTSSPSQSCRIKMTRPSVEALRQAFLDPDSRIRLLTAPAPAVQYEIAHLTWEGGFLDGVAIPFSPHLNCLIGGRGTGKSTVVESIRAVFGVLPLGSDARKRHEAVLKNVIRPGTRVACDVSVHRPSTTHYKVEVVVPGDPVVRTADGSRSTISAAELIPGLEIYGQHEVSELARDPKALTGLLSRFLDQNDAEKSVLRAIRRDLEGSRSIVGALQRRISQLEEHVAELPRLEELLKRFEEAGLGTHLKEQAAVINEVAELDEISGSMDPLRRVAAELGDVLPLNHDALPLEALGSSPLAGEVETLKRIVEQLSKQSASANNQLNDALERTATDLASVRDKHNERRASVDQRTQALLRSLGAGSTDGQEYLRTRSRIKELLPMRADLAKQQEQMAAARKRREELLSALENAKGAEFRALERAARRVSRQLENQVRVSVRFQGERSPLVDVLRGMGGRMAETIALLERLDTLTPVALAARMREGASSLRASYAIPANAAERLASASLDVVMSIEELALEHTTTIELNVAPSGMEPTWRRLEDLSSGQRATAVLLLLLLESNAPLVVDQPEDDLDNRFIADGVVPRMRREKHRRQLIFATHNANIPVLGDAELIAGFQAAGDGSEGRGELCREHVGSLDVATVKSLVEQVLEGGSEAFELRRKKYRY